MSLFFPFCPLLCGHRTNFILEHIKNCKNKHLLGVKYFQCPYNPTHIFGKKVFQMHVDRCPDRFKNNHKEKKEEETLKISVKKKEEEKEEDKKEEEKEENTKEEEKEKDKKEKEEEKEEEKEIEEEKEEEKEIEDEKKQKEEKKKVDDKEGNIIIEDEKDENDLILPKRHHTSIMLDRYHHHSILKELLFKPDSNFFKRKQSEHIPNKYKDKLKEDEIINNELLKIHENVSEIKEMNQKSKNNSSKNLIFKGILKHNLEKEKNENLTVRKHNSSHKVTLFLKNSKNKGEPLINFDDDSDNDSDDDAQIANINFKRGRKRRSVTFKNFVKVFVFDEKKNKPVTRRSAFAKSSIKKKPEMESEDISAVYMKSL